MPALLMPSDTPIDDLKLLGGEYAAMRPATRKEMKRLKLGRRRAGYATVVKACAGIEVIVVPTTARKTFDPGMIDALMLFFSRQKLGGVVVSKAAVVMHLAGGAFPSTETLLRDRRPTTGPCPGCTCMWKPDSYLTPNSHDRLALAADTLASQERAA